MQSLGKLPVLLSANRRIFKTAVAAGVAWALAERLLSDADPYFAPLTAILTLQLTVADSLYASAQRLGGVVIGVVVAFLLTRLVGLDAWTLGLLVLVSLSVGGILRMAPVTASQAAISALLVAAVGASVPGYAWRRIAETVVGAVVAVAINALIVPPDHLDTVAEKLRDFAGRLSRLFSDLGAILGSAEVAIEPKVLLERARALHDQAGPAVRAALALADQGLKWNYFGGSKRPALRSYQHLFEALERVLIIFRGMVRTLGEPARRDSEATALAALRTEFPRLSGALGELVRQCAGILAAAAASPARGFGLVTGPLESELAATSAAQTRLVASLEAEPLMRQNSRWFWLGSLVTDLSRVVHELRDAFSTAAIGTSN